MYIYIYAYPVYVYLCITVFKASVVRFVFSSIFPTSNRSTADQIFCCNVGDIASTRSTNAEEYLVRFKMDKVQQIHQEKRKMVDEFWCFGKQFSFL